MAILIGVLLVACFFGPKAVLRAFGGLLTLLGIAAITLFGLWYYETHTFMWGKYDQVTHQHMIGFYPRDYYLQRGVNADGQVLEPIRSSVNP